MHDTAASLPDVLPEIVLVLGAVVVLVFALFTPRRWQAGCAVLALITLAAAAVVSVPLLDASRLTMAGTYAVDGAAVGGKLIVLAITAIVVALSLEWFRGDPRHGEYYTLLILSALGAVLLAGASDLMQLVLAVLLASSTGYVLVAYHRRSRRAAEAAIKYYLLGALAGAAMLYGVVLLFGLSGTTTFEGVKGALANADATVLVVAFALVLMGLAFKLGAVPVHAWLPDAADGAPAPVAAFVAAAPKVGALIALARLVSVLPEDASAWRPLVALLAAATMTLGNVAALWQDDVRRLLGWSAVSQSGYAMMAVVALDRSELALPGLLYFITAYALGNLAAFGVVVELRGRAKIAEYAGLGVARPLLALAMVIALLSFIGIPPLAGFAGKLALFGATIEAGYGWLAALAVINTVISVAYYARVLAPMYFAPAAAGDIAVLGRWATTGTTVSAALLIAIGIVAEPLLGAFAMARLLP